jgi:CRISPR-associated protein Cas2
MIVVCFDVCNDRRLRKVAKTLGDFGTRVQRSVFECHLNDDQLVNLQQRLAALISEEEDHVRYYPICPKDMRAIAVDGPGERTNDPGFFIA